MSEAPSTSRLKRSLTWLWRHLRDVFIVAAILAAFVIGYTLSSGNEHAGSSTAGASDQGAQWYTCSMHPEVRLPNPDDKCPICHMSLIPVGTADASDGLGPRQITLSDAAQAMINVSTTPATRRIVTHRVDMVGQIEYDETRLAYITAYVSGRLDRLFVDYTGIEVRKGDHLAEIYSPQLLVALQEIREARQTVDRLAGNDQKLARDAAQALLDTTRERLRLLGLTDEQIKAAERGEFKGDHITLYAPNGGIVIEKNAKRGSYVKEGDRIYTIADLSTVWVILEAYESDLPWIRYGQKVRFTTEAFGDRAFEGTVAFIDPVLNRQRRTARIRVNVDNREGLLRPGMFVRGTIESRVAQGGRVIAPDLAGKWISPMHPEVVRDEPGDCPVCGMDLVKAEDLGYAAVEAGGLRLPLVVPQSAVLRTGKRGIVYVKRMVDGKPVFQGREIELGPRGEGFFIVRSGLDEGDLVVTRGNFQIDSALQIDAKVSMMRPDGKAAQQDSAATQPGQPKVHLHGPTAAPVAKVFDAYLALSKALANDDAKAARQAAAQLAEQLTAASKAEHPEAFTKLWQSTVKTLDSPIESLQKAADIAAMRKAFEPLTDALAALLERSHIEGVGDMHRAHCPMAFDNVGASWITDDKQIRNPYFGASMLKCGSIKQSLHHATHPSHE